MSGPNQKSNRSAKPPSGVRPAATASGTPAPWLTAGRVTTPPPAQFAEAYRDRVPETWDAGDEDPERWDGMS